MVVCSHDRSIRAPYEVVENVIWRLWQNELKNTNSDISLWDAFQQLWCHTYPFKYATFRCFWTVPEHHSKIIMLRGKVYKQSPATWAKYCTSFLLANLPVKDCINIFKQTCTAHLNLLRVTLTLLCHYTQFGKTWTLRKQSYNALTISSLHHMAQSKTLIYNSKLSSGLDTSRKQFHTSWSAAPVRVRTKYIRTFPWRANIKKSRLLCTNSPYHVIPQSSSVWAFVPETKWRKMKCRFG